MVAGKNGRRHFTVVGAGTVGVCCAFALLRDGHRVTLIDRDEPGRGCSFGNGGIIQVGASVPVATPGVLRQVPGMLLDPDGPLVIRWSHLPRLVPYLVRFIAAARPERVERIAEGWGLVPEGCNPCRSVARYPQRKRERFLTDTEFTRLTGALLDRLTHHVHILEMNGQSFRLNHSRARKQGATT